MLPLGRLPYMEPWAKRLLDLLEAGAPAGLSMAGLARAVKAKQPSVWQWFNAPPGKAATRMISAINAVRAAAYVGTTAEYLMTGRGEPGQPSQPARFGDETMAQAVELLHLMADARPDDPRFARPSWSMIQTAAKVIDRASGGQREIVSAVLAEIDDGRSKGA